MKPDGQHRCDVSIMKVLAFWLGGLAVAVTVLLFVTVI